MSHFEKIKRLNEHHESFGPEVLDMTVGELLDKLESLPTREAIEAYSVIEDQLYLVLPDLQEGSYDAGEGATDVDSVEGEEEETDFTPDTNEDEDFPSFSQSDDRYDRNNTDVTNNSKGDLPSGNINNFTF